MNPRVLAKETGCRSTKAILIVVVSSTYDFIRGCNCFGSSGSTGDIPDRPLLSVL